MYVGSTNRVLDEIEIPTFEGLSGPSKSTGVLFVGLVFNVETFGGVLSTVDMVV